MTTEALTHKQLETRGCELSTVATDVLMLKHRGISTHSADQISVALDQIQTKNIWIIVNNITKKNWKVTQLFKGSTRMAPYISQSEMKWGILF